MSSLPCASLSSPGSSVAERRHWARQAPVSCEHRGGWAISHFRTLLSSVGTPHCAQWGWTGSAAQPCIYQWVGHPAPALWCRRSALHLVGPGVKVHLTAEPVVTGSPARSAPGMASDCCGSTLPQRYHHSDHEGDGVGGAVVSVVPEAQEAADLAPLGNW